MILQRTNFNVPARFSFQPYSAKWRLVNAEILEWTAESQLHAFRTLLANEPLGNWLRVRIEVPKEGDLGILDGLGFGLYPSYTVCMDRASIPPDVLQVHENSHNTPDVSGRSFRALICQKPEFRDGLWKLTPEDAIKNAWIMRDEFVNLKAHPEFGWDWNARAFLNKWGIWEPHKGFKDDWSSKPLRILPPSAPVAEKQPDKPDFVLLMPHLLQEQQAKYRRAMLPSKARSWLRSHSLSLETGNEFPFFHVRSSYCRNAIEATITIDHLSGVKSGICKRCRRVFEKEKNYKMSYCGRSCANAASVARFRERQRKPQWTAAKIAKLLSQKGAKRNAKG